jgi:hypothetical protein
MLDQMWFRRGLLLSIMLIAAWLRLWRLPEVPPGLWYDEAYNAMDALWMLDQRSPQVFLVNNTGREPMYHYLAALSLSVLGATPYALRLVSALIGVVTIPLVYRWVTRFFAGAPERGWLGLITAAGLTFSMWHVVMSRLGFRAILIPFFVVLTIHLFWLGCCRKSLVYFMGAGLALGLSQYTYLSARVLPLLFGAFVLIWTIVDRHEQRKQEFFNWVGLLVMAIGVALVFLPLGMFLLDDPGAFFSRTGQVFVFDRISQGQVTIMDHLLASIRLFVDGYDEGWRHNLVGQPAFDWLSLVGFWIGLLITIRRVRQSTYLFLIAGLPVLWFPALLSVTPVHALRLAGLLPIVYTLMAVGLVAVARTMAGRWPGRATFAGLNLVMFVLVVLVSGSRTVVDYFFRWARAPGVYVSFDGPVADLTHQLLNYSETADILLPYQFYTYPTTRLLLHDEFRETDSKLSRRDDRPLILVTMPNPARTARLVRTKDASYVLLTRNNDGAGLAYVSRQQISRPDLSGLASAGDTTPFYQPYDPEPFALLTPVESLDPIMPQFTQWPALHRLNYDWDGAFRLVGFEAFSKLVQPGETMGLKLYWQGPLEQPWKYKTVIEISNGRGETFNRWEQTAFPEEMFRWRPQAVIRVEHPLFISPQAKAGPYPVWLELLAPGGKTVPASDVKGQTLGHRIFLGLLYIGDIDNDPRVPAVPFEALLDNGVELVGFDPPAPLTGRLFRGRLYWRAANTIEGDYVPFVHLLDDRDQIVTGWEAAPLAGQYPTSAWKPGEVIVDEYELNFPVDLGPGQYRLVAGMIDPESGSPLAAVGAAGKPWPHGLITLIETR